MQLPCKWGKAMSLYVRAKERAASKSIGTLRWCTDRAASWAQASEQARPWHMRPSQPAWRVPVGPGKAPRPAAGGLAAGRPNFGAPPFLFFLFLFALTFASLFDSLLMSHRTHWETPRGRYDEHNSKFCLSIKPKFNRPVGERNHF
jgi:hypothetical protein